MSATARTADRGGREALVLWAFAGTLFLSAFLLFSVQPIFAKMVLPKLGGAPSVWAVSMCFFQAVLLLGYCYAHGLDRLAGPRYAARVHAALLALAFLQLPFGLPASAAEPPAGDAYLWLIGVLAAGVGLPFFAIAANAPLLQAWFTRSGHPHARDPYFLYGASNLGSLLALLCYPIAIEPLVGLSAQAVVWTAAFAGLALLIVFSALMARVDDWPADAPMATARGAGRVPDNITWRQRAGWAGTALVPSGLLVAFTSYVSTDLASAPFLWVIPLAVYLLTFVLVFRDEPLVSRPVMLRLQPLLVIGVMTGLAMAGSLGWLLGSLFGFAAFVTTTLVCHRRLYDSRPAAGHLTEFYLWMSLGGVIGGVLSAIAAPHVFNALYEFPLLLVLGMTCHPGVLRRQSPAEFRSLVWAAAGAGLVVVGIGEAVRWGWLPGSPLYQALALVLFGAVVTLEKENPARQLVALAALALSLMVLPNAMNRGEAERSFFGTHRVETAEGGQVRLLMHGTTVHGSERIKTEDGAPVPEPRPATYYYADGPLARGVEAARNSTGKGGAEFRVGIVGLGAGSMACYARADETWRFFEIDPVVARIARDPARFSFLARCLPHADIVLGDARLTLARETAHGFGYLVIDAFASDAVPTHLLTREALALYLGKLDDKGILAMHVSNRHLDLVLVAGALARSMPGVAAVFVDDDMERSSYDRARSHVVFMAKSEGVLAPLLSWPHAERLDGRGVLPWTDDYSNILAAIWRKYAR